MILHENCLPADDSHEISCLICYFLKSGKILNCRLLQIIGGALRVKKLNNPVSISQEMSSCHPKSRKISQNVTGALKN